MPAPLGIVIVEVIFLVSRSQRRRVLALLMPRADADLRIVTGTIKSEVKMSFLSQSIVRPWGENWSLRMSRVEEKSSGHSWMMLKLASVSTRWPGEVPTAAVMWSGELIERRMASLTAHVGNEESAV